MTAQHLRLQLGRTAATRITSPLLARAGAAELWPAYVLHRGDLQHQRATQRLALALQICRNAGPPKLRHSTLRGRSTLERVSQLALRKSEARASARSGMLLCSSSSRRLSKRSMSMLQPSLISSLAAIEAPLARLSSLGLNCCAQKGASTSACHPAVHAALSTLASTQLLGRCTSLAAGHVWLCQLTCTPGQVSMPAQTRLVERQPEVKAYVTAVGTCSHTVSREVPRLPWASADSGLLTRSLPTHKGPVLHMGIGSTVVQRA